MKNMYEAPDMEIRYFEAEDICAVIISDEGYIPGNSILDEFGEE